MATKTSLHTPERLAGDPHAGSTGVLDWLLSPRGEVASATLAGFLLLSGWGAHALGESSGGGWGGASVTAQACWWGSLALGLVHGGRAAMESLRARRFDIDVLMVVGAVLAAVMGAVWEGALLLFLFVLAGGLEGLAMQRTTRAVEALHKLMPTRALKQSASGDWQTVEPEQLQKDDLVKVLPGELVPADGRVEDGQSSLDQSSLTGESMPRSVAPGDEVFAGTINIGNPMICRVTRAAKESSLQRVLNLVLSAQQQREPVQRFIDRVNEPYALGVLGVSVSVFFIWWLGFGDSLKSALFTAITLLIVCSPCAVIIATPTATLAAIARGARGGVLFKGGQSLERLARLGAIAFDKTGTLTLGKMRVRELHPVGWSDADRLLSAAAGLEQDSTHPIAAAIRTEAQRAALPPAETTQPEFVVGRGVQANIEGLPARLGTWVFVESLVPVCLRARVQEVLAGVQSRGEVGTVVAWNEQAGVTILSDSIRPGAESLVDELHELGVRPVVMLTGDNRATAAAVASQLKLDRFEAELLPANKVEHIQAMKLELVAASKSRRTGLGVGVIGDGVNDAPALAAADVSMAIGSIGSDAALESADTVLLSDDLRTVPWALKLARRARRTITINLLIALTAIVAMAVTTLVGSRTGHSVPLWLGVLTHEGGTILVVAHSLLLLAFPGFVAESPSVAEARK